MKKILQQFFIHVKRERIIYILFFIGLIIRVVYSLQVKILPWCDMSLWDQARLAILYPEKYKYTVNWPPVYPLFLAAITILFGNNYAVFRVVQAFISSLSCILIYLITKNTFNRKVGIISLIISCFYIDMIWMASELLAETLGIFLFLIVVYFIIKEKSYGVTGALFGLTVLTKGVFLLALPGIIIWIWIKSHKELVLARISKFLIFMFLTLTPWTVRNYFKYKAFVLVETHLGVNIFLGHNPTATGGCDYLFYDKDFGRFYFDDSLTIIEKDRIALKTAINFAITHPLRELQLVFLKLSKYWAFRTHFDFYRERYPLRKVFFLLSILIHAIIFPLCFLGAVFSMKNKNAIGQTILILNYTIVFITLLFASGRMHFPLVPSVIILSAWGFYIIPEIVYRFKIKDIKPISKKLITTAIITILLYANFIMQVITRYKNVLSRFE